MEVAGFALPDWAAGEIREGVTRYRAWKGEDAAVAFPLVTDGQSAWLRQKGREVWWYTAGNSHYPYANFASFQNQLIEGRILIGWQTWRKRADGFLFWLINGWQGTGRLPEGETFFPQFKTDGRRKDAVRPIGSWTGS